MDNIEKILNELDKKGEIEKREKKFKNLLFMGAIATATAIIGYLSYKLYNADFSFDEDEFSRRTNQYLISRQK